ncbi:uncharacterized protein LOC109707161 isoform X2 [Ananas comosus]|uniref:Uncharacterized protein LOC109707161 isoform X2 n=1 Tax=Ananas comosus TaxID=4615 RepID=A0A6P5ERD0_ANACO|nr:uncharacterized protein LOC109707161 isoform X2 [Ananas comosus]XP_020083854.1 uncharacterized protein LOC109707161 isoform X2 [Ananas comosus]XP_020083856.1 uncharacterized protein LOC109707161 isoform X2 [Ananas comosus]
MSGASQGRGLRLFDAHCHLQDRRISAVAPQLIGAAVDSGVVRFAVNGVSERDWHLVKRMAEQYPSVIPCFGLHPWYVAERSPNWLRSLREFFADTPTAAVGEIGLDRGSHGKKINFDEQEEVFLQQLELAKELERPVSVHCVRAFGDLLGILKRTGPFPAGVILHSYLGSADMVASLANLGSYFSFSGYLTNMKVQNAKKILRSVPLDRILLETDAPDGMSTWNTESLIGVPENSSNSEEPECQHEVKGSQAGTVSKDALNHPANIHNSSLIALSSILAYFMQGSYKDSKLCGNVARDA